MRARSTRKPAYIYNYAVKAQYERRWRAATLACGGNVRSRPFGKFFNLDEHEGDLPIEPLEVFDKLDGSLGINYRVGDEIRIATRGSFHERTGAARPGDPCGTTAAWITMRFSG